MKDTDLRFCAEVLIDALRDTLVVPDEGGDGVRLLLAGRVPAVVTKVVQDDVKPVGKQRPEREIRICGKSVGVAEDESRSSRSAVSSEDDRGSVSRADLGHGERLGDLPVLGVSGER